MALLIHSDMPPHMCRSGRFRSRGLSTVGLYLVATRSRRKEETHTTRRKMYFAEPKSTENKSHSSSRDSRHGFRTLHVRTTGMSWSPPQLAQADSTCGTVATSLAARSDGRRMVHAHTVHATECATCHISGLHKAFAKPCFCPQKFKKY
eukprot:4290553-Amphidinium_carterae.1